MSENSTLEYFVESNGSKPDLTQVRDNRLQLLVDGRQVETWELVALETLRITDWLMIFPRYLARGDKLISPNLPHKPLDELTESEIVQIRESEAYKMLKHFKLPALKAASKSFVNQAGQLGDDPN